MPKRRRVTLKRPLLRPSPRPTQRADGASRVPLRTLRTVRRRQMAATVASALTVAVLVAWSLTSTTTLA